MTELPGESSERAVPAPRRLVRASTAIAVVTLLTKLTGFIRVAAVVGRLGASRDADAFLTAFLVPETLYVFLTEGAVTTAFVPPFTRALGEGIGSYCSLFWTASLLIGVVAALVAALLGVGARSLVTLIAPGFDGEVVDHTRALLIVILPYIPLTAIAAVAFGALNARERFLAPAAGPLAFNIAVITGAICAHPGHVWPLAWGVLGGGLFQLALQLPSLIGISEGRFRIDPSHPGLREVGRLLAPLGLSLSVTQIQMLAERAAASYLPVGTITNLNMVQKLVNLPLGLVGIAVATPLVPELTRKRLEGDTVAFNRLLQRGLGWMFALTVPLAILCYVAADPIVQLLFVRGAFGSGAARDGALMLRGYAPGLPAVSACFLLTGAFFATGDSMTPSLIRAVALTVNVVLNFALLSRLGLLTIPISYSAAYLLCLAGMSVAFRWRRN